MKLTREGIIETQACAAYHRVGGDYALLAGGGKRHSGIVEALGLDVRAPHSAHGAHTCFAFTREEIVEEAWRTLPCAGLWSISIHLGRVNPRKPPGDGAAAGRARLTLTLVAVEAERAGRTGAAVWTSGARRGAATSAVVRVGVVAGIALGGTVGSIRDDALPGVVPDRVGSERCAGTARPLQCGARTHCGADGVEVASTAGETRLGVAPRETIHVEHIIHGIAQIKLSGRRSGAVPQGHVGAWGVAAAATGPSTTCQMKAGSGGRSAALCVALPAGKGRQDAGSTERVVVDPHPRVVARGAAHGLFAGLGVHEHVLAGKTLLCDGDRGRLALRHESDASRLFVVVPCVRRAYPRAIYGACAVEGRSLHGVAS